MALTKLNLVQDARNNLRLSYNDSAYLVEQFIELMKSTLASGEDVLISGFGKFSVLEKKCRRGRNTYTGDDLSLEARRVVSFDSSGVLRKKLNGKK